MFDIQLYDVTLRDGAQAEGVAFSLEDKLNIALKLDELGFDYVEGGFSISNPKDSAFFREAQNLALKHARISAFGSTRRPSLSVEEDPGIDALLKSEVPVTTIVGKAWDIHVNEVLRTELDTNIRMIAESVEYLKKQGREVVFDAEHFFDGFKANPEYAISAVKAAADAGADVVVLCDTNGGAIPTEVNRITAQIVKRVGCPVGFHGHNDGDLATANSLAAVEGGATHVQGTINGLGERTGNADHCAVIPNLALKMNRRCIPEKSLERLTELSRYIYEVANLLIPEHQPFVGLSAFAHKGGLHVDAVLKNPITYEHIRPEQVGNERRFLVSELSGGSTILAKIDKFGITHDDNLRKEILQTVKEMENAGYQFEAAEASFEVLVKRIAGLHKPFFDLEGFRVLVQKREENDLLPLTEATIKIIVGGEEEITASEGNGPVNALDGALRKALERFYPTIKEVRLVDYKVRVINTKGGTGSSVRVIIESRDDEDVWGTVGVSENIIQASWEAMVDSIEYKLSKDMAKGRLK